uniref:Uncharacterized protein n=1 Tax=Romanomermis culicivorax TaxID=13658 RepID=A0A915JSL0_ROMCU
ALDSHDLLQGIILKDTPRTRPKSKFDSKRLNAFRERSKFDHRQLQHLSLIQAFTALPLYQAHIHRWHNGCLLGLATGFWFQWSTPKATRV